MPLTLKGSGVARSFVDHLPSMFGATGAVLFSSIMHSYIIVTYHDFLAWFATSCSYRPINGGSMNMRAIEMDESLSINTNFKHLESFPSSRSEWR